MTNTHSDNTNANSNGSAFMLSHEEVAEAIKRNSDAVMRSLKTATGGANQICQSLAQYSQNLMQLSMTAFQAAASARTLQNVAKVQTEYAKTALDHLVENSTRIGEMALKIANDAAQPLKQHANETLQKFSHRTAA